MATKKPTKKNVSNSDSAFHKFRGLKQIQQVSLVLAAIVVVGVSTIGSYNYGKSSAAKPGGSTPTAAVNTLTLTPASAKVAPGSPLTVTLLENSGSVPVNVVQAKINYDASRLQFVGIDEAGTFTQEAATDTSTPGVIQIARAITGEPVTGTNAVVKLNFVVKTGVNGGAVVSIDSTGSILVEAANATNLLTSTSAATFNIRGK